MSEQVLVRTTSPEHAYPVVIGRGLTADLAGHLPAGVAQVLLVHSRAVTQRVQQVREVLRSAGVQVTTYPMPDGEAAKDLPVIAEAWHVLGEKAFARSDAVLTLGGGAVTDAGGFIAATWLRGVPVVHLPTTLLGMVDAAVGGKTGINTAAGKNLVGAIHSPQAVLCDLDLLDSLPVEQVRSGMAEVIKCGFIADARILDIVEADPEQAMWTRGEVLADLIRRAVAVKADVVAGDLHEADRREFLNYGHTLGHAIENVHSYRWRHGDAVAVGMVFAAELAARCGYLDGGVVRRHRQILTSVGLPTEYQGSWDALRAAMSRDKKSRAGTLRFIVLRAVAEPVKLSGPDERLLTEAFASLAPADHVPTGP